eukprot:13154243-Ditylum_brightwellii.AAC.2
MVTPPPKYALLIVNHQSRYTWIYSLKGISGDDLQAAFHQFQIDAGGLPQHLYTDFNNKLIHRSCQEYLNNHHG